MRVIAGTARGLRLDCPAGITRPMMDRVRGAVFSSLGDAVPGARALDLFAGSGAIGIEALSRGAASCHFVDRHRRASEVIRSNLARANLCGAVRQQEVAAYLGRTAPASFDLVFADPPFALATGDPAHPTSLLAGSELARCVAPGGFFVVELPQEPPEATPSWELLRNRRYGQAWVAMYRRTLDA